MAFFAALNFACLAFNVSYKVCSRELIINGPMSAHLVPGAVPEDLEDQLLLRAGVLHRLHGGLVRALCRDMRPLLLKGEQGCDIYMIQE